MSTHKILLILFISFLLNGCKNNSDLERETRSFIIKYKNGVVFCDGFHSVLIKNNKPIERVGIWKFYYPNGSLESIKEYSKEGELINRKDYFMNGNLAYSTGTNEEFTSEMTFYENGKLKMEYITKINDESAADGENTSHVTYSTSKEFYPNGQPFTQNYYENDIPNGEFNVWDTSGNLILTGKYEAGLIVN
jgi:antitoxin component YwqK of YwqJK toxin-antitoxin module